jgi:butyryl-CoA dehydrogenase
VTHAARGRDTALHRFISKEHSAERRLRDAWGWDIAGGAIDILKADIASATAGRRFDQRR